MMEKSQRVSTHAPLLWRLPYCAERRHHPPTAARIADDKKGFRQETASERNGGARVRAMRPFVACSWGWRWVAQTDTAKRRHTCTVGKLSPSSRPFTVLRARKSLQATSTGKGHSIFYSTRANVSCALEGYHLGGW